jgi:hypothetical protein
MAQARTITATDSLTGQTVTRLTARTYHAAVVWVGADGALHAHAWAGRPDLAVAALAKVHRAGIADARLAIVTGDPWATPEPTAPVAAPEPVVETVTEPSLADLFAAQSAAIKAEGDAAHASALNTIAAMRSTIDAILTEPACNPAPDTVLFESGHEPTSPYRLATVTNLPKAALTILALPGVESIHREEKDWCCYLYDGWTTDALGGGSGIIDTNLQTIRAHVVGAYQIEDSQPEPVVEPVVEPVAAVPVASPKLPRVNRLKRFTVSFTVPGPTSGDLPGWVTVKAADFDSAGTWFHDHRAALGLPPTAQIDTIRTA